MVAVGGVAGLYLQITPSGARSWILRATAAGKRSEIGLGPFPEVSLADARSNALALRLSIREGADPVADRRAARSAAAKARASQLTFAEAVDRYLAAKTDEFKNEKHRLQWQSTLHNYAVPKLGARAVNDLEVPDILAVLQPIWSEKTETASRLRGRMEAVLAWAKVSGYREGENPARWAGNLSMILPSPSRIKKVKHFPSLQLTQAQGWWTALRQRRGTAARALEFLTLCASRSGEVRGAVWSEIDLERALWIVPAPRMKMEREHIVPLSSAALGLLNGLPRLHSDLVFPSSSGKPMSDMALSAVMRRMHEAAMQGGEGGWVDRTTGRPAVPHGLRSTFRTWAAEETNYPGDLAEFALAHKVGSDIERAYLRSTIVEKRRAMMNDWADFLGSKARNDGIK